MPFSISQLRILNLQCQVFHICKPYVVVFFIPYLQIHNPCFHAFMIHSHSIKTVLTYLWPVPHFRNLCQLWLTYQLH